MNRVLVGADDTGRIRRPLTPTARRLVFGRVSVSAPGDLELVTEVDRAHLVMLAEQGIVDRPVAGAVLAEIARLRSIGFAPLQGREARRGLYLLYEDWLASRLGLGTAGVLRTGRSRNDLNATVFLLRLRPAYQRLMTELLRLQAVLLSRARRHQRITMPAYTHYQAAVPITLGHYLAGVARAVDRDIEALAGTAPGLGRCPLGAGAGGGTSVPLDPTRVSELLGFEEPVAHSLDAVAAREPALRLLAGAAVLGVTLSRLATDLLLWTTAEFGFLSLPDELVGSSSLMPQKRNPFLLEHVKGRSAAPLGALVASATAMHATPFANSVAVGTEACAPVIDALEAADATALVRLVVAGAQPDPEAMLRRAMVGHTVATAIADHLVFEQGISFREAHHLVGAALSDETVGDTGRVVAQLRRLGPAEVAAAARHGGGPGAPLDIDDLRVRRAAWSAELVTRARRWAGAAASLDAAVAGLVTSDPVPV
jgi:argininosuccinate lyase